MTGRLDPSGRRGADVVGREARQGELRILILEDVAADAELTERELRQVGMAFSVTHANTRDGFVAVLEEGCPDLILADYSLPSIKGPEALALTRERCPDVPLVFVSGAIGEERAIETLKQGATDYVLKDRMARLVPAVRRAVSEGEERRARRRAQEALREAHQELERRFRERAALLEVNNAIIANLDRDALFDATTEALRRVVPFDRASLTLYDSEADLVRVLAVVGEPPGSLTRPGASFPGRGSHLGAVLEERRPLLCRDLGQRPRSAVEDELFEQGIRSFVSVPLMGNRGVVGTLNVGSREPERYSDADAEFLLAVGEQIALAIENMLAYEEIQELRRRLELENVYLREEVTEAQAFGEIVGRSPAIRRLERQIEQVAPTDATALILGESGTGKELVAREIHRRSGRRERALIRVNCASIPRELYESEFFGHVKGAFTGAVRDRVGRFEAADGGTLFLDEVGEIPPELQAKLLRVLQEGEFERVGEARTRQVDVRVIAASNRDLEREMKEGRFREDLFYRLNVFPIRISPLRDRTDDLEPLAVHFLEEAKRRLNRPDARLSRADLLRLAQYDWPGNVRELRNVIERAIITSREGALRFDVGEGKRVLPPVAAPPGGEGEDVEVIPEGEMRRLERENLRRALERAGGKIYGSGGAAELLGIPPTTLASRLKSMGLSRADS